METLEQFLERDFKKLRLELIQRCDLLMDKHRRLMEEIRREKGVRQRLPGQKILPKACRG